MLEKRNNALLEIDHLLEIFTEQYLSSRSCLQIIPLIEIDLMKNTLSNLYQQLSNLEKIQSATRIEDSIQPAGHSIKKEGDELRNEKKFDNTLKSPEAEINIPIDNSIKFADLLLEKEEIIINEKKEILENISEQNIINETISVNKSDVNDNNNHFGKIAIHEENKIIQTENNQPTENQNILNEKKGLITLKTTTTLFDLPVESIASAYKEKESLSAQISKTRNDESIADKLQKKPLVDLKKSIGINERFAFINELFDGNQIHFNETIETINTFNNYEEANNILHNELATKYKWDLKSHSFNELHELIKRRFQA